MELLRVLKATGGTPEDRRHLFRVLERVGIQHDHSIFTARAVFAFIEVYLENNNNSEISELFEMLQDIVHGKVRSRRSLDHLHDATLSLTRAFDGRKGKPALGSAIIQPLHDEPSGHQEAASVESVETKPIKGYCGGIYKKMGIVLIALCAIVLLTREPSRVPDGEDTAWEDLFEEMWLKARAAEDEIFERKRTTYDRPRLLENPTVFISPPPANEKKTLSNQKVSRTINMETRHSRSQLRKYETELSKWKEFEGCPFGTALQICLDHMARQYRDNFQHGRVIKKRDEYLLSSAVRDKPRNDAHDQEVVLWLEHVLRSADPVYLQSQSRLKLFLSEKGVSSVANFIGTQGYYDARYDIMWVKSGDDHNGGPVSISERQSILKVLVHELAHRIHLGQEHVASECWSNLCKDIPIIDTGRQIKSQTEWDLTNVQDEVDAVLYLGYESEDVSYEEAVLLNQKILDMGLRQEYSHAMQSRSYQDSPLWGGYWSTSSAEFFAEASVSFLVANSGSSFPSREWIEIYHPELFRLLSKVWSGAKYASFDELQTFSVELAQKGVYDGQQTT